MWVALLFAAFLMAVLVGTAVLVARHVAAGRRAAPNQADPRPEVHDATKRVADRYRPSSPEEVLARREPAARHQGEAAAATSTTTLGDVWRRWDAACREAGAEYFLAYSSLFLHGVRDDGQVPLDFFYVDVGMMADQVTKLRAALLTGDAANDGEYRVLFPDADNEEAVEVVLRHEPTAMMVRARAFYPEGAVGVPRATPPPPAAEDSTKQGRRLATLDGRLYPRALVEKLVEVEACGARVKAPAEAEKLYQLQGDDAVPLTLDQSLHPGEPPFLAAA